MLTIWRRHREKCPHKSDRYYRKCRCACHCEGTVEGVYRRQSLKTRSWERATELVREIEDGKKSVITLSYAISSFMADMAAQGRADDTVRKYRLLFSQMNDKPLSDFTFEVLSSFRASWKENGAATRNKKLDRLKSFFRYCHDAGFISVNPTKRLKQAAVPRKKVQPFSREEQMRILSKPQVKKIRCFVHVMYHAGLRISDCCFLKPEDFDGNCIRRVNRKNNVEIYVPIPPDLKQELDTLPLVGGYYFLIGQSEHLGTQTDAWRTILNQLYKTEFHGFHAHRFRHTRVVEWLAHGLTLEEISGMVGTSVKILEKHYASFAPSRQQVVAEKLRTLWEKPKLLRVK